MASPYGFLLVTPLLLAEVVRVCWSAVLTAPLAGWAARLSIADVRAEGQIAIVQCGWGGGWSGWGICSCKSSFFGAMIKYLEYGKLAPPLDYDGVLRRDCGLVTGLVELQLLYF